MIYFLLAFAAQANKMTAQPELVQPVRSSRIKAERRSEEESRTSELPGKKLESDLGLDLFPEFGKSFKKLPQKELTPAMEKTINRKPSIPASRLWYLKPKTRDNEIKNEVDPQKRQILENFHDSLALADIKFFYSKTRTFITEKLFKLLNEKHLNYKHVEYLIKEFINHQSSNPNPNDAVIGVFDILNAYIHPEMHNAISYKLQLAEIARLKTFNSHFQKLRNEIKIQTIENSLPELKSTVFKPTQSKINQIEAIKTQFTNNQLQMTTLLTGKLKRAISTSPNLSFDAILRKADYAIKNSDYNTKLPMILEISIWTFALSKKYKWTVENTRQLIKLQNINLNNHLTSLTNQILAEQNPNMTPIDILYRYEA